MNKRWVIPVACSAVVAAIAFGAGFRHMGGTPTGESGQATYGDTLSQSAIDELKNSQFTVEEVDQPPPGEDQTKAIAGALASFDFLSPDQVESVTLVNVESEKRGLEMSPAWIVCLTDVTTPDLGGGDTKEPPSTFVVLVDPDTYEYTWAVQS